uniref:Glutathione S-transferase n=1 Tax=Oryza sativa subsp. japonica TaxID=39947 RepID=Q7Y1E0_ORYSJ|nr:putative glutathione S-transferase [Oryza sativa Japonica Group]
MVGRALSYKDWQVRCGRNYVDKKLYRCGIKLWRLKGELQAAVRCKMVEILWTMEAKREFFFCSGGLGFTNVALVLFTTWFYSYEWCGGFSINEVAPKLATWARQCI